MKSLKEAPSEATHCHFCNKKFPSPYASPCRNR
jgi:hypothetical protein